MDDVLGLDLILLDVGRAKAEHIQRGDRLRALARAEDVANHTAEAGIGPRVGFDGAGVVVRLHLEADGLVVVELHKARVVLEGAEHEVGLRFANLLRHVADVGLEQPVHDLLLAIERVVNLRAKDAVLAVLAPGLRDDFHLHIRRFAALIVINLLHCEHVRLGKRELHALREIEKLVGGEIAEGDGAEDGLGHGEPLLMPSGARWSMPEGEENGEGVIKAAAGTAISR